jgi:cytochrome P450
MLRRTDLRAGIHFCLGYSLAKAELQSALPLLARRMPDLALNAQFSGSLAVSGDAFEWHDPHLVDVSPGARREGFP